MRNFFISNVFVATLAASLVACDEQAPPPSDAARPVKMLTVAAGGDAYARSFPAVVTAERLVVLSFAAAGQVASLPVREAQQVKRGETIARLDARDFKSAFDSARAEFDNAEKEYQRAVQLADAGALARNVLDEREATRDIKRAAFDAAKKSLDDSVLTAPFAGVIAKLHTEQLENLDAQAAVATLLGEGGVEAVVNLPAAVIARVNTGAEKTAFVTLASAPDRPLTAAFKEAALEADPVTQTYAVTFAFDAPDDLVVLPGMNASVVLKSAAAADDTLAIPLSAVVSDGDDLFVWVVDAAMSVAKRAVTVADGIGDTATVTAGLAAGETIVTAGVAHLFDGMKVRRWQRN